MSIIQCPRCGKNKKIDSYIRRDTLDGRPLHPICPKCRREVKKKR